MKKRQTMGSVKSKDPLFRLCRQLKSSSGQHQVVATLHNLSDDLCSRANLTGEQLRQLSNVMQKTLPHLTNCYSYSPNVQTAINEVALALLWLKAYPTCNAQDLLMKTLNIIMTLNVDRVHHLRIAKLIQDKMLFSSHYSVQLFSKMLECLVECRHCRQARVALIENLSKVLIAGPEQEALDCLQHVIRLINRPDMKDEMIEILCRPQLIERITKLIEQMLKNKRSIEGLPELLILQPYGNLTLAFRQYLKQQPTEVVNELLQHPKYLEKLLPEYRIIVSSKLAHSQLALLPGLLPAIRNIMSSLPPAKAQQVLPQLDIVVELIESKFLKGVADDIRLLDCITNPQMFKISFYRSLVQLDIDTSSFFSQLMDKAVKNGKNFNRTVFSWSDLINIVVDQMISNPAAYTINQTTFLAIHQHLSEQYFKQLNKHQSCWLFLTRYVGHQYHLWRYAASNICREAAICRILSFYSTMPTTFINSNLIGTLKKDLHSNDIRSVAAIMQLLHHMPIPSELHQTLVVFISNNWEHICRMASRRQSTMSELAQQMHSACQKLGEVEMQLQNNILIDCLRILNKIPSIESYLPMTPQEFSEGILRYCQERVSQYHLLAYRIVAQLQRASSCFMFDKLAQRYLNTESVSLMQMATCLLVQTELMTSDANLKTMTWRQVTKICLYILKIESESYTLQTQLLSAKYLALQAYRVVCCQTRLKNDLRQLMNISEKILFGERYLIGPFDSHRQTLLKCEAVEAIFDSFESTPQQLKILSMASEAKKQQIRFLLLKNCILRSGCLPIMLLLTCDNSQVVEDTATVYVRQYVEHMQPVNIIDSFIKLAYCLEFSTCKDRVCCNFVNLLSGSCMAYVIETMQQIKEMAVCQQMQNAINKRKKIHQLKGAECHRVDVSDHPLLVRHPS